MSELSERQQQVLQLMARGQGNRAIAEKLGVTPKTIGAYAEQVYVKLGARNRSHAVAIGLRQGLIR